MSGHDPFNHRGYVLTIQSHEVRKGGWVVSVVSSGINGSIRNSPLPLIEEIEKRWAAICAVTAALFMR